jgi:diguanylate cyclase (GGDEF)-like protein/PAS domain S-box-containing protein
MVDSSNFSTHTQVVSLLNEGEASLMHGDYVQAINTLETALALVQQVGDLEAEIFTLQQLGSIHLQQNQLLSAQSALSQALSLAIEQQDPYTLYDCHRQLATIDKASRQFESALSHFEAAEAIRGDIFSRQMHSALQCAGHRPKEVPNLPQAKVTDTADTRIFQHLVDQAHIGIAIFQQGHMIYHNQCLQQWLGYTQEELQRLNLADLVPCADYVLMQQCQWRRIFHSNGLCQCEKPLHCKDGHTMDMEFNTTVLDYHHRPAIVTFIRPVTNHQPMEGQLQASAAKYHHGVNHAPLFFSAVKPQGTPMAVNPAMVARVGDHDRDSQIRRHRLPLPDSRPQPPTWAQPLPQPGSLETYELQLIRHDGGEIWVKLSACAIYQGDGSVSHVEGAMEDITTSQADQATLEDLAIRDALTNAYNRHHFMELADQEIARTLRFHRPATLMMLDIDHFKTINDTYGQLVGDRVLRDIVLRVKANLRQSDLLARYGDETFIILMPETNLAQAWMSGERLRMMMNQTPFSVDGRLITVTTSIGVTSWADGDCSPTPLPGLIHQADEALNRAKRLGRNQTHVYGIAEPSRLPAGQPESSGVG